MENKMNIEGKENKITDRSYKFAIDIINMVKNMPKELHQRIAESG